MSTGRSMGGDNYGGGGEMKGGGGRAKGGVQPEFEARVVLEMLPSVEYVCGGGLRKDKIRPREIDVK